MRRLPLLMTIVLLAMVGVAAPGLAKKPNGGFNTGPLPDGCVKFEGGDIGAEGVAAGVDGVTVTLTNWVDKGEPGEFVGFDLTAAGGTADLVSVKSGRNVVQGPAGPAWLDPDFAAGDKAKAISNVVVCVTPGVEDPPSDPAEWITE